MKHHRKAWLLQGILAAVLCLIAGCGKPDSAAYTELGKAFSQQAEGEDSIVAQGKHVVITETELNRQIKVYEIAGRADVREDALSHLIERKTLLYAAGEKGITVSEEDLELYIQELKNTLEKSSAQEKEALQAYYDGFGGEDVYWEAMRKTIGDSLVIEAYFRQELGIDGMDKDEAQELEKQLTRELVEAEEVEEIQ